MLGLSLREGILAVFLAIACFKQHLLGQDSRSFETCVGNVATYLDKAAAHIWPANSFTESSSKRQEQDEGRQEAVSGTVALDPGCHLSLEWNAAFRNQRPVVLQRMTNKVAYNGHVGVVKNCTNSRFLVAVHGVFFNAEPTKIWVKHQHVRLLEASSDPAKEVDMDRVKVKASSNRGDFPLHVVLEDDERKWWISRPGSFTQGRGEEFLDFVFASPSVVRVMGISIPPMPMGPLSVREFAVEADVNDKWKSVSPRMQTLDRPGLQEVALDLVETRRLRVKFLSSAAPMDSVGLFQIRFF